MLPLLLLLLTTAAAHTDARSLACAADAARDVTASTAECAFYVVDSAAAGALLLGWGRDNDTVTVDAVLSSPDLPSVRTVATARDADPAAPPDAELYHEGGVWLAGAAGPGRALFVSRELRANDSAPARFDAVVVDPSLTGKPAVRLMEWFASVAPNANGAALVPGTGGAVVLVCVQGGDVGGGLLAMNVATGEHRMVVTAAGVQSGAYNSPNDVVVVPVPGRKGFAVALFTDPPYGIDHGLRPGPPRSQAVWAVTLKLDAGGGFPSAVGAARAVAGDFVRVNGLAVSPDRTQAYVSDTGYYSGGADGGGADDAGPPIRARPGRPNDVYVYRLSFVRTTATLTDRRLFATAEVPVPDGLKVDTEGRLYVGDGGGVSILEPQTGRALLRVRPGDGGGTHSGRVGQLALVPAGGGGRGAVLVLGQGTAATAVDLPGATPFDVNSWL